MSVQWGSNERQERGRDQETADDGYHHSDVDAGSERRKCNADGGEGCRRDHAIRLPSRKVSFEALPVGSVEHHGDLSARKPAGGVKVAQAARDIWARRLQLQDQFQTPHG